ncbi:MAG: DUF2520 domain-containing protein, partial [Cellvibrionaceae bacterium]|nr:DUF2520 domain-containing protein [Cellvibrionaceae bacterium]
SSAGASLHRLQSADVWLIACPDSALTEAVQQLLPLIQVGSVVFHCSGALSSAELAALGRAGAHCASVHPLHSFASPASSIKQFTGSHCAYEGDAEALAILLPAFKAIGAQLFAVNGEHKLLYHAGSVIACNYLTTLLDHSLQCFASAGIEREQAMALLQPLMAGTLDNIANKGPAAALTGPIARADRALVQAQWQALAQNLPAVGRVYRQLGQATVNLAQQRDNSPELDQKLNALAADLKD